MAVAVRLLVVVMMIAAAMAVGVPVSMVVMVALAVLVRVFVTFAVLVVVGVMMLVRVRMGHAVCMVVFVGVAMGVVVVVMAIVSVVMRIAVLLRARRIDGRSLDLRFAVSASARPTHQSTSSSLILNSSPPVTCNWKLPQLGQVPLRSFMMTLSPHAKHHAAAAVSTISSVAFSAMVPRVAASKQKRSACGSTVANGPTSSLTTRTRE
jgi:hypothetical protein